MWQDLHSIPAFPVDLFAGPVHSSQLKVGTPVATLPGVWYDRVMARTGWPGVSICPCLECSLSGAHSCLGLEIFLGDSVWLCLAIVVLSGLLVACLMSH